MKKFISKCWDALEKIVEMYGNADAYYQQFPETLPRAHPRHPHYKEQAKKQFA